MLNFLTGLGGVSLTVTVFIILLVLLRGTMRLKFTAACRYTLWVILILRLCVPVGAGIMPRLITISTDAAQHTQQTLSQPQGDSSVSTNTAKDQPTEYGSANPPVLGASTSNVEMAQNTVTQTVPKAESTAQIKSEPMQDDGFSLDAKSLTALVFTVWAIGCVTFITAVLLQYNSNIKIIKRNLTDPGRAIKEKYYALCKAEGIKAPAEIYLCRAVKTPMVYGFFKSRVILPELQLSQNDLECVLRHELVHYTRRDLYIKLIALIANAMHWFNPFAYVAVRIMTREMELSCDEQALDLLDKKERLSYGESMLQIVRYCKSSPVLTTGFDTGRRAVKERFENILNFKRKRKGYMAVALTLALSLLAGSVIGCAELTPAAVQAQTTQTKDTAAPAEKQGSTENTYIDFTDVPQTGWSLSYDSGVLILEHDDGRAFRYTDSRTQAGDAYSVAFYPVTNADASLTVAGDYAFIIYKAPVYSVNDEKKENMIIAELSHGRIIQRVDISAAELVSAHSLPHDLLAGYKGTQYYVPLYDITLKSCIDEEKKEVCINITLQTYDSNYIISGCRYFNYENAQMSELAAVMGVEPYKVNSVNDINDLESMEGIDQNALKTVTAFLNKDTATLEQLCGYVSGRYSDYATLVFGQYSISRKGGIYLRLDVDIIESAVDGLEPGTHTFFYQNFIGCYMEHACGHYDHVAANEASKEVQNWLTVSTDPVMPYKKDSAINKYAAVEYLTYKYGVLSPEQYAQKAEQIFSMCNVEVELVTSEYAYQYETSIEEPIYEDGDQHSDNAMIYTQQQMSYYTDLDGGTVVFVYSDGTGGKGGILYFYDVISTSQENDIYTATFQFYADYAKTLKAEKVTYTFRKQGDVLVVAGENGVENPAHRFYEMYIV